MKRFVIVSLIVVTVVVLALLATQYTLLYLALPDTQGRREVSGLDADVRILRDARGIPTIRAESEGDAFFGLGYVHAQDRLWQMDMMRRLALGRLSEILGDATLKTDQGMRLHGFGDLVRDQYASLDPATRDDLQAYARGVNAFLRHDGALGTEFAVLGYAPEPWKAWHSLLWPRLMALRLSGNWNGELLRLRLAKRLPAERGDDLWASDQPGPVTVTLPEAITGGQGASNAWVARGDRTATGAPLLAGDPHLGLTLPSTFHLGRLEAPGLTLAGAFAPGVPFLVIGHNGHVAWTFTTTHADTADLYLESDGDLIERREAIQVDGAEDVSFNVRIGRHGPIVSDLLTDDERRDLLPDGRVLSLAAAFRNPDDTTPDALRMLNRARDMEQALDALAAFEAPVQNVMLADTGGRIGFSVAGRIPLRADGHAGWVPIEGDTPDTAWRGFIPASELPRITDPADGVLINSNNRVIGESYPHFISRDWAPPFRAGRVAELLNGRDQLTADDFRRLQMDHVSRLVPHVLPVLLRHAGPATDPAADAVRERLAAWDGGMDRERAEPLIFFQWLREAGRHLWHDELGDDHARLRGFLPLAMTRMLDQHPIWCDDVTTPDIKEDCDAVVGAALDSALGELRDRFGGDPESWRWGDAHRVALSHPVFGRLPVIGRLFTEYVPTDGGETTVSRGTMASDGDDVFAHRHGSVLRAVFDLADLDRSGFIMPGGQSSHLLSDHYDDLTPLWAAGELVPIIADPGGTAFVLAPPAAE